MTLNRPTLLLALLAVLAAVSFAQNNTTAIFEQQTGATQLEIISSWQLLSILALIISAILVGLGYAMAIGFEMPELKAWAGTELTQVFSNVILVAMLIVIIGFLDVASSWMVSEAAPGGIVCNVGENCMQEVSLAYLSDYISAAEDGMRDVVKNNMQASAHASRGVGIYALTIYVGQLGISFPIVPHYTLDVDRHHIVFEYWTGMLSSLYSQQFFLEQFAFKVGPVLLALGVFARAFFFSRKTGGLLIAIAAGVMFFLPGMYLFDWVTLDMMVAGDNAVEGEDFGCPAECSLAPPYAFYENTSGLVALAEPKEVYAAFSAEQRDVAKDIVNGDVPSAVGSSGDANGRTVYACNYDENRDDNISCGSQCRELPYPNSVPECANADNQLACAALPAGCKVARLVTEISESDSEQCPSECKIVPPLKSDCNVGDCLASRLDCRVAKRTDLTWRPHVDDRIDGSERCNDYPQDCPANLTAEESCVWVLPETGTCDDLCIGCPAYCRIKNADEGELSSACSGDEAANCESCPDTCKADTAVIEDLLEDGTNCSACPAERRLMGSGLPADITTGDCSFENCPRDYRVYPPRSACEQCITTPENYMYDPPVNVECSDLCKPSTKVPSKSSGEYTQVDEEGLVGKSEIKNVSRYMIPAYLLPLFNIAATLIFIKGLSGMISGDIEIPGVSKIF